MPTIIAPGDLAAFADIDPVKAEAMIEDALADASRVAPCISDEDLPEEKRAQFKSILRAAVLRWNEAGSGAFQQQTAGPFTATADSRQVRRGMFWPSEIEALQSICRVTDGAFMVDMTGFADVHDPLHGAVINATIGHEPEVEL